MTDRPDQALDALEHCEDAGTLPSAENLIEDTDLDPLRDHPRFIALLARVRERHPPQP